MKVCSNLGYSFHLAYLWRGWGVNALARGAYDEYSAWRAVCVSGVCVCVCVLGGTFECLPVCLFAWGCFLCVGSYAVGSYWLYHATESTEKFVALIKVKTKSPEPSPSRCRSMCRSRCFRRA